MIKLHSINTKLTIALLISIVISCKETPPKEPPLVVREDPATSAAKAAEIRKNTPAQLAEGLTLTLWASDSLAPDPVAMSIDDEGRVYLTRTNRQKNSEFDIRGHRDWMIPSISLQTVEERRSFLRATFAPEKSKENEWLEDLNHDGSHDWKDLAIEKDEVWRLEDKSGDGYADVSTRILNDFHDEVTDVAGGLLIRDNDAFVTIGPDMWRVKDTDGDGVLDEKTSISHGYAVHIGFSGHGMSGAIEGPDGKIYWQIGDIGANITAPDGKVHAYPNEGVLVRSNEDGSDFEVFAAGIRNTHEFVFDEYGNIISSDNDGDHPGESERLVYLVEGSDQGWRSNWQYGKYVDPKNNEYKVWMEEGLYKPRWEGQAAYIIPPIVNFHNGPTGMVYNPGTALGSAWKNNFFLVEFVGNPSRSHIWAFTLKPKGASFELVEDKDVVSGILPTGIKFGPDGALYVADWINGWGTKNYGRVWKLDVTDDKNDLKAERAETKRLMILDYAAQSDAELGKLLFYGDMRIRQKAQFELASRGQKGWDEFKKALDQRENQLARVHAIWGMGQLGRKDKSHAAPLVELLKDEDAEIVAQAAKVIGEIKYKEAGDALIPVLQTNNPRAIFFAAQALGRIEHAAAVTPIIQMLEKNNDEDNYLRHAGVLALSRIGQVEPVIALSTNSSKALRTAAVLVLRRLKNENVAIFLQDKDEYIVTEAARAINDDLSIEKALPALAATLNEKRFTSEPLLRRGVNACLRVGGEKEMDMLIAFAKRTDVPANIRAEALATLGVWASPSTLDRVDGRLRGKIERDPAMITSKVRGFASEFLQSKDPDILVATTKMMSYLGIKDYNANIEKLLTNSSPAVRSAAITSLSALKYDKLESVIKRGMEDKDGGVRAVSVGLLNELDITKENLPAIVQPIFKKGTVREQQELLKVLGEMPVEKSEPVLDGLIDDLANKKLPQTITLDLMEAVDSTHSEKLIAKLKPLRPTGNKTESFMEALYGGDARRAGWYFMTNSTAQCVRCHAVNGEGGGTVGPDLGQIGDKLSREEILRALIEPSARLAPGFGSVKLTLKDGQVVSGILMEESADELIIKTSDAEPLEVSTSRISKRENTPSAMPPMGTLMSKREIRDMVELLANFKKK
ncbi:MAG TPA: HEAT repeat domain-containing protein [Chryseolinea sp.]